MKNFLVLFSILLSSFAVQSQTKHLIRVYDHRFEPNQINIFLGDTIRWEWEGGDHTTTSVDVPFGAVNWHQSLNSGSTFFEYVPDVTGSYGYFCLNHGTTENMSGMFGVWIANSIDESKAEPTLSIHPNPFQSHIFIEGIEDDAGLVSIYALDGKLLMSANLSGITNRIDLSELLTPGIYFCSIQLESGQNFSRKIIKTQ